MGRHNDRSLSPPSKRRHTSRDRFERFNRTLTPERSRRPRSRSPAYRPRHVSPRRHEYSKPPEPTEPYYRALCVSSLHPNASDELVKDTLYREFRKFDVTSIKVQYESDERVAYVSFRNCEDARDAKDEKSRIILYDKVVVVEKAYEVAKRSSSRYRGRSPISPRPYYDERLEPPGRYDHRAPYRSSAGYHHRKEREYHYKFPKPPTFHQGPSYFPPSHTYDSSYRYPPVRPPYVKYESKKDKYPDHLLHICPEDDPLATRTLFVGNLEINIPKEELYHIFGSFGVVEDIDVKRPQLGTGNAFAFIRFQNLDMAHKAKVALSGSFIGQFQCKIGYGKAVPTPCVWVGGLGSWTSITQLEREFDRFGTIKKLDYSKDDCQAFILYENIQAASAAVREMRGCTLGSEHRLRVDFSGVYLRDGSFKMFVSNSGRTSSDIDKSRSRSPIRSEETALTLSKVASKCSKSWNAEFSLKSSRHLANFYLIDGDEEIVKNLISEEEPHIPQIKITQRIRLEQPAQIESVKEKLENATSHATILALTDSNSVEAAKAGSIPARSLNNLVFYFKQKRAAGVTVLTNTKSKTLLHVYSFPYCPFSAELLRETHPDLPEKAMEENHLVIVVV